MYNSDLPTRAQLPTSAQLVRSTLIAAVSAAMLLITVVLPAEYAIDPTGLDIYWGAYLGTPEEILISGPLADVRDGIVAAASVADYDSNRIRKHEFTRPDKEDDRVRNQRGQGHLIDRAAWDSCVLHAHLAPRHHITGTQTTPPCP